MDMLPQESTRTNLRQPYHKLVPDLTHARTIPKSEKWKKTRNVIKDADTFQMIASNVILSRFSFLFELLFVFSLFSFSLSVVNAK